MASQSKAAESPRRKALVAEISSNTSLRDHKRDASAFVSAHAIDWVEMTRPRARNDAAQAVWARHSCLECGPDILVWPRARKVSRGQTGMSGPLITRRGGSRLSSSPDTARSDRLRCGRAFR